MESTRCHRDVFKQQCPSAFSGMDPSRCLSDVMGARSARLRCVERSRLGMASDGWGHEPSAPLGKEKTGPNPTDRAKRGVKRSLLVEGHGIPIGLEVEGANRNDAQDAPGNTPEHSHCSARADRRAKAKPLLG